MKIICRIMFRIFRFVMILINFYDMFHTLINSFIRFNCFNYTSFTLQSILLIKLLFELVFNFVYLYLIFNLISKLTLDLLWLINLSFLTIIFYILLFLVIYYFFKLTMVIYYIFKLKLIFSFNL